jgi:heme a synthase
MVRDVKGEYHTKHAATVAQIGSTDTTMATLSPTRRPTLLISRGHITTAIDTNGVRIWLLAVAGLVLLMIGVGGATRLTGSGLSITEWKPLIGAIPPLTAADWATAFGKYQQIPQYTKVNAGMNLTEFKTIFWWEWGHRFLGRVIGLAFALPLLWFVLRRRLPNGLLPKLVGLLALGGVQAGIGWYMVASGLVDRVDVSQYRLALHLSTAFLIFGGLIWVAMGLTPRSTNAIHLQTVTSSQRWGAALVTTLIGLQVVLGAFVAGLKAGLTYNTWPLMDGRLIPNGIGALSPWYLNLFENITTVQFNHRMVAYVVTGVVLWHGLSLIRSADDERLRQSAGLLIAAVTAQVVLGIWTLLAVVPVWLGVIHQAGAAVLFGLAVRHVYLVRERPPLRAKFR